MIKRIGCKIEPLWDNKQIVYKILQRNDELINCKTIYFNKMDYLRKWIINKDNKLLKELSCLYEDNKPILASAQIINYLV